MATAAFLIVALVIGGLWAAYYKGFTKGRQDNYGLLREWQALDRARADLQGIVAEIEHGRKLANVEGRMLAAANSAIWAMERRNRGK